MTVEFFSGKQVASMPFIYTSRIGNTFSFENPFLSFSVELKGKELFDFIDQYNIGDNIYFDSN